MKNINAARQEEPPTAPPHPFASQLKGLGMIRQNRLRQAEVAYSHAQRELVHAQEEKDQALDELNLAKDSLRQEKRDLQQHYVDSQLSVRDIDKWFFREKEIDDELERQEKLYQEKRQAVDEAQAKVEHAALAYKSFFNKLEKFKMFRELIEENAT